MSSPPALRAQSIGSGVGAVAGAGRRVQTSTSLTTIGMERMQSLGRRGSPADDHGTYLGLGAGGFTRSTGFWYRPLCGVLLEVAVCV